MAATRTLVQLRTEARQRADMETDDSFIADAELTRLVNQSCKELYDILIEGLGQEFFYTTSTVTTVAGTASYTLPATFYQMLGVDAVLAGSEIVTLRPFRFMDRNDVLTDLGWRYPEDLRYRIMGTKIYFTPTPDAAHTITLHFIPCFTDLSADADTFDGINGWEEYVIVDVASKMLEKEESDASHLYKRKAELEARIRGLDKRDQGTPEQVIDIYKAIWR